MRQEYVEAQAIARRITGEVGEPLFYREKRESVEMSRRLFREHPMVEKALAVLEAEPDRLGHGLGHVTKVAIDAGAIILVERENTGLSDQLFRLVALTHIAGILHDIRRAERDHARKGSEEAERILRDFDLDGRERSVIVGAIANHEAFQPSLPLGDTAGQLLSDALYDADKFRWGPDNFSEMLWDMVERRNVPLSAVLGRFIKGMEGVGRVRETFRTETGRYYGPDFIDRGMEIGRRLYKELAGQHEIEL